MRCQDGEKKFVARTTDAEGELLSAETHQALLVAKRMEAEEWFAERCGGVAPRAVGSRSSSPKGSDVVPTTASLSSTYSPAGDVSPVVLHTAPLCESQTDTDVCEFSDTVSLGDLVPDPF